MYRRSFPLLHLKPPRLTLRYPAILALLLLARSVSAAPVDTGKAGQIVALPAGGDSVDFSTDVRIPLKGWTRMATLDDARNVQVSRAGASTTWTGRIPVEPGKDYQFDQTLSQAGDRVDLDLKVTANADVPTEGVYYWIDIPIADFTGGKITLGPADQPSASAVMPAAAPTGDIHFLSGTANRLSLADATARTKVTVTLGRAIPIVAQDTRQWQGSTYSVFLQLSPGLKAGETTSLKASFTAAEAPITEPAHLTVDPKTVRYQLDGFGGDYCFDIESPVTQYTLKNLKVRWARTEMSLAYWEPQDEDLTDDQANWQSLAAHDQPGTRLRDEFLLAKQIQGMGIPYVISVWELPTWLYADPERGAEPGGRHVPDAKRPALLKCLGSYLLYAKRQYGVEPDLFSFNEADYGVHVKLNPDEVWDAIKRIGPYFRKLGLKTKMLLGDTGGPRGNQKYCLPTAADPVAMQYVGALSFHSWGGATPEQYGAWADLAERLHRPLLVAELGVDSDAWKTNPFDTLRYALDEAKMYQELVLYARPQGTMQWEFTSDYSLVKVIRDAAGQTILEPGRRFFIVKQFLNLTPPHSDVLTTTSDASKILLTGFAGHGGVYTFHITNLGGARTAILTGLPGALTRLRAVRTGDTERFKELGSVPVKGGRVTLNLAPQSLLTLTTLLPMP